MTQIKCVLVYLLTRIIILSHTARILAVYPVPSFSHQIVFRPLTLELVKRGHEVVVITPNPMFPKGHAPQNLTEIDVHNISYTTWQDFMKSGRGNKEDLNSQIKLGLQTISKTFEKQLQVKEISDLITGTEKFDLLMIEACVQSALYFSHIYKAPVIQVSSFGAVFGNYDTVGAPSHPILYSDPISQRVYNLSMWEKLMKLYNTYKLNKYIEENENVEHQTLKKYFGLDIVGFEKIKNNVDMLFLNVNPIWEGNRPVPPNVIHIGGLPQKPKNVLPEDLKKYLDSSQSGVVYVSFGTNVNPSQLPSEKIQVIMKVLSKLPFDVLMKWDKDMPPGKWNNILFLKWLPQSDLLRHPKIKLFITQGGLQSTDEAILAGVPLIGIPMLGDQWYNAEKYEYHRIGLKLDLEELCEETLKTAIETVIGDESYRKNIIKLREIMVDQPMSPLDRAIWWIEYVLRHGGAKHLRSPAANITWIQYYELGLVSSVLVFLTVLVVFLSGMFKVVLSTICTKDKIKIM